jgi:hypothetical protein
MFKRVSEESSEFRFIEVCVCLFSEVSTAEPRLGEKKFSWIEAEGLVSDFMELKPIQAGNYRLLLRYRSVLVKLYLREV